VLFRSELRQEATTAQAVKGAIELFATTPQTLM
jgi:hypothetical protein